MDNKSIHLRLWYEAEAPKDNEGSPAATWQGGEDKGWERWSLPIGNGYFGANIFGRCETERIQITEKTLQNPPTLLKDNVTYFVGGLNNFSETYIDFGHSQEEVTNYKRYLDLETGIAGVEYTHCGIKYTREYFTSYPHKALVIRLDANKEGELSFTLRPTIPYIQPFAGYEGDGVSKEGAVTSWVEGGVGTIELSGKMNYYGIDFLGIYRVYTKGNKVEVLAIDGTIRVKNAISAYIVVTLGTDYELTSQVFTSTEDNKPTMETTLEDTRAKVCGYMSHIDKLICGKDFEDAYFALKEAHIKEHSELFGRVTLDLGTRDHDLNTPTDRLLEEYKSGNKSKYLEMLLFQYGRYLLIASSRKDTLPATLQGAWNTYNMPPWSCDYTHNINVQMNYWPAFSTNLAETFEAYVGYNKAYMERAKMHADDVIKIHNPEVYGKDGGNGWVIGAHVNQFRVTSDRSAGNLGFTTQLFWEYYSYTKDPSILSYVYDVLVSAARYITKCTEPDEEGNYLVSYCDSPEVYVEGVWYYTKGTTYAQTFAYLNNYNALLAAKELGINLQDKELLSREEYSILATVMEEIDKYSPIHVGLSGQLKEFRQEDFYSSIGEEYQHRHVSQLVGLYPGNIVTSETPAWLDAAKVVLTERGDGGMGWSKAHKMNLWARAKEGKRAYELLSTLIEDSTAYNLWNIGPPFQIDGSFGATAGISEMLLQSHEGYISPLPGIPSVWKDGSYTGLVARGGFEVSVEWHDGFASQISILSKKGGEVKLLYPSVSIAKLQKADGSTKEFTMIGKDMISFETEAGETYTVSGLTKIGTPDKPEEFGVNEPVTLSYELKWRGVPNASVYNIYIAVEDASTYTLIGTSSDTSFVYKHDKDERITFAVSAVNAEGNEGKRALCYTVPSRQTPYGVIPGRNAAMPFALFVKGRGDYSYVDSFMSYKEALCAINKKIDTELELTSAVVYVARNHKIDSMESWDGELPRVKEFVLDLGKRALEFEAPLLDFSADSSSGEITRDVTVLGGNLLSNAAPIFVLNAEHGALNITLRDVRIAKMKGTTGVAPLFSCKEISGSKEGAIITFDGCRIDFNTEPRNTVFFDANGASANYELRFVGGELLVKSLERFILLSDKDCENVAFSFIPDSEGKETAFKLTEVSDDQVSLPKYLNRGGLVRIGQKKVHFTRITEYKFTE